MDCSIDLAVQHKDDHRFGPIPIGGSPNGGSLIGGSPIGGSPNGGGPLSNVLIARAKKQTT